MNPGLSHSQLPIWVGQRLHPSSPLYNMAFAFTFDADLDFGAFAAAWEFVARESALLRTRVEEEDGVGIPVVGPVSELGTRRGDLGDARDRERAFEAWCDARATRALRVDGPLVESVLFDLGPGRTGWYLNQHHLVCDAWSTVLLYERVSEAYRAVVEGREAPVAVEDYYRTARALTDRVGEMELREATRHWADRTARDRHVRFYGREGVPVGTASTRFTLELDDATSRTLDEVATQTGLASLSTELSRWASVSALFLGWLSRVSGESEPGFDAPVAGRSTPRAKGSLGPFIELFPFASSVTTDDSLRALGARCLEEARRFLQHAHPGLGHASGERASNAVLNFFPGSFGPFAGVSPAVRWVHPGHGDSVHGLRLQVHDFSGTGRYVFHFDFNDGMLEDRIRRRAPEHFSRLVDALLEDPDRPIAAVDIRTNDERTALATLNDTGRAPRPDATVVEMFAARALETPDAIALRQADRTVTFAELEARSRRLASDLVARGVRPGDRIALSGTRSIETIVGVLGVLRAGGAFVPLDPAQPPARTEGLIEDSDAVAVLVGPGEPPPPAADGVPAIVIDDAIRAEARDEPGVVVSLDDLAYVLFTSGSTGRPKGVMVEHRGLATYLRWASDLYVRGERLTFPLFTSLAFDLTMTSLFLPLITGGVLEIYPESGGPVDTALMDVAREDAVDFIKLTPSHLSLFNRAEPGSSRARRMVVGGEDLKTRLAAAAQERSGPELEIYNEYGPTEAVVGCTAHRYDRASDTGVSVPIGAPADHVEVEILNAAGVPVPEGVPGELRVSGLGLARGYQGMPEATAERFDDHPSRAGFRRYRTGDVVRLRDPATLAFLGRADRQVKVSGFRVELGEIEAILASRPDIDDCAVVARDAVSERELDEDPRFCARCGLPSNHPAAAFDAGRVCGICREYESIEASVRAYFKSMDDLEEVFRASGRGAAAYDCMMLLSGGKDSTYALCRLVDMGLSVYAYTLDNGFISDGAKENMRRVTDALGVPLELGTTPAMKAIFRDSLERYSNVCQGCFKTIYTLSTNRAHELGIPIIVTGLSRGQMFETRLTHEMFQDGRRTAEEVDAAVATARKVYHRADDEVSRSLDVRLFRDDRIFEEIAFVDFYRYCDVDLSEMLSYLDERVPWVRPADTGRSTNCLINDLGIYVHRKEKGFHNYALPYSWDVRLGHKTRAQTLHELQDELDEERVRRMLADIEYVPSDGVADNTRSTLAAFYVGSEDIPREELVRHLSAWLPPPLVPATFERLAALPMTVNGKLDEAALPRSTSATGSERSYRPPEGPVQEFLAEIWAAELGVERAGRDDDFFELGGTSLGAMEVMLRLCREFDIELALESPFEHRSLAALARVAEDRILADATEDP
ncbi:MAG: amino acid adenylation domain-containing protein [Gemmatimonadetes bacterium]|nr:amino acid adenylation domain-containing protein [Gemmatimonadota bacterium]